ncbi:hypothetical protein CBS101457_005165 [Exobasidium rhododendri]|nr:hypothetical protein CBS101457_005165 [Exobasidium rhododendri]
MTGLPYSRDEGGADPALIPLTMLRAPAAAYRSESYASSTINAAPPAHHMHPHGFDNNHFYEGIDPGYQADATEGTDLDHDHDQTFSSGSKSWIPDHNDTMKHEQATYPPAEPAHEGHFHGHDLHPSDTEDETDDFDWNTSDDENDLTYAATDGKRRIRAKRGRKLYLHLMQLTRPVRVFIIGLIGTAVLLIPFIVVLAAFKSSPARPEAEVWSIWLAIIWAAGCGTFLVLDWVPPVVLKIGVAFYGKAPELFKTYVEVLIAIKLWIKLVLCISWAWISLGGVLAIQFSSLSRPAYFKYIFRVIQAFFGSSIIVLVEKLLLQIVAINFHKTALKDRLESNQGALKALDALHDSKYLASGYNDRRQTGQWAKSLGGFVTGGSRAGTPGVGHASRPSRDIFAGYFNNQQHQPSGKKTPSSADSPQNKRGTGTPTEKEARKANFANQLSDALATATMKNSRLYRGKTAKSQLSARKLAKKLFTALGHNRETLVAEDFYPFFATPEEAQAAFKHFDADNNGDISKTEMRDAVQRIYREKRALATSIKDMSSAVSKLDGVLLGIALVVIVFIWLLIFNGDNTVANIAPLSTFVVGFSFIFGNSAKTLFESMVFIFATHPYDVGDLVCVDDNFMFVVEFGLISTTFRTVVNQYIVAPNAVLAQTKMIINCRRSGNQWETTNIQVGYDSTLLEMIDDLRSRLRAWVKTKDREWAGGLDININEIETGQNAVELTIAMEHKGNWQSWGDRWNRRTQLMRQVKIVCQELGIRYQLPVQPVTFTPKKNGTASYVPRGPRLPSPSVSASSASSSFGRSSTLPVGGVGRRQMTKAEAAAAALKTQ